MSEVPVLRKENYRNNKTENLDPDTRWNLLKNTYYTPPSSPLDSCDIQEVGPDEPSMVTRRHGVGVGVTRRQRFSGADSTMNPSGT